MYLIGSEWLTWIVAFGLVFTAKEFLYWRFYVQHLPEYYSPDNRPSCCCHRKANRLGGLRT